METLKLTSIRLDRQSLEQANRIAKEIGYYQSSSVIRIALWAGLKIVNSRNHARLAHLLFEEDAYRAHYELDDVLRAAAQNKEGTR